MNCNLCPRKCNVNRKEKYGYCGVSENIKIARAGLHFGEEPIISGENGSGTVFFSGCSLKCVFCQNYKISENSFGKEISTKRLSEIFLELQSNGANNINLVSPSHYALQIINALKLVKEKLNIPVVYNTSGYERVETLDLLKDYVDIYLTDIKYKSSEISKKYSNAENYFEFAIPALIKMYENAGKCVTENNLLKKGVIIRHLVLPGCKKDSIEILEEVSKSVPVSDVLLSLMSQYTPCHKASNFKEINRKITSLEYKRVVEKAEELGFSGFIQERNSATLEMTPNFDLTGV